MNAYKLCLRIWLIVFVLLNLLNNGAFAMDSLCAKAQVDVRQEVTAERQAFDATLKVSNGVPSFPLANLLVTVSVRDEEGNTVVITTDPNAIGAAFFMRLDSKTNVTETNEIWSIAPATQAELRWTIIPSVGAAKGAAEGTAYYVGATVQYTLGGEPKTMELMPDYIFVKPLPDIQLDYFLPSDVYGDDPFTPLDTESPEPFSLSIRAINHGAGVARDFKVDSGIVNIIDNKNDLLVAFNVESVDIDGKPYPNTLLANFGDIAPNGIANAHWYMTSSLAGRFTNFTATFTHADVLGGQLT